MRVSRGTSICDVRTVKDQEASKILGQAVHTARYIDSADRGEG